MSLTIVSIQYLYIKGSFSYRVSKKHHPPSSLELVCRFLRAD